jgi:hypothetical protein
MFRKYILTGKLEKVLVVPCLTHFINIDCLAELFDFRDILKFAFILGEAHKIDVMSVRKNFQDVKGP